jgi:hypothetical protein
MRKTLLDRLFGPGQVPCLVPPDLGQKGIVVFDACGAS